MDNRPQGREKNITGQGKGIQKRGDGLGTGKVGGSAGIPAGGAAPSGSGGGKRSGGSGGGLLKLVLLAAALLGGGYGTGMLGGGEAQSAPPVQTPQPTAYAYTQPQQQSGFSPYGGLLESLLGGSMSSGAQQYGSQSTAGMTQGYSNLTQGFNYADMFGGASSFTQPSNAGWAAKANTGVLNTEVAKGAAAKRTKLYGNGKDTVTVMLYMCGSDLESRSGMATKDLQEMLNADVGSNVNLIIYTGGCSGWRNNVMSSSVNQIYQVRDGQLTCLERDCGSVSMMKSSTLSGFIAYCAKNFPANRNMLILWDHGGGSVSGYGYDEKYRSSSMTLKTLNEALQATRTTFDFIGFDACLMGTVETALTMAPYADYLIASEETEPGVGWYYTNWLTALSRNTSIPTTQLGKQIIDDFVDVCAQKCRGQQTTLSLTDLAELSALVPKSFNAFASSTAKLLANDGYATVSNARSSTREFASSEKLDQVDLVHMSLNLNTPESKALSEAILSAVKYNRTSSNMTNAYGLSVYFPYKRSSQLSTAVANYEAVGISPEYSACIKQFSALQSGGQSAAGMTSPLGPLTGGSPSGAGGIDSADMLTSLLSQLLGGGMIDSGRSAAYILDNSFDANALFWQDRGAGSALYLNEEQWALVQELELNVFVDVGDGYADLGLDNTFSFTADGALSGCYDNTWLAIDGQEVAYYHIDSTIDNDRYTITGRVPVLLNGSRADLILVFDSENPYGYIAGARFGYKDGETDTVGRLTELNEGDVIDFLCDFYTYDGEFDDCFMIGESLIYSGEEQISNVYLSNDAVATYRFTDIYSNSFWTPPVPMN